MSPDIVRWVANDKDFSLAFEMTIRERLTSNVSQCLSHQSLVTSYHSLIPAFNFLEYRIL